MAGQYRSCKPRERRHDPPMWRRLIPVAILLLGLALFLLLGLERYFSFEMLSRHHATLAAWVADAYRARGVLFVAGLCAGRGVLAADRHHHHAARRLPVRRLAGRPAVGDRRDAGLGGGVPGGAHRLLRSLPCPRRRRPGAARGRLPPRQLQLSAVPAAGAGVSLLAGQYRAGAARHDARPLYAGDPDRHHSRRRSSIRASARASAC